MAQSVEPLILDLSSGLNLGVVSSGPALSSVLGTEPALKTKTKQTKSHNGSKMQTIP